MSDGKVFVRPCSGCGQLHQTADSSGKERCATCATPAVPTPKVEPVVETLPAIPPPPPTATSVDDAAVIVERPKREKKSEV